jgi:hypothetical protein
MMFVPHVETIFLHYVLRERLSRSAKAHVCTCISIIHYLLIYTCIYIDASVKSTDEMNLEGTGTLRTTCEISTPSTNIMLD